jgi:hypothetical protein
MWPGCAVGAERSLADFHPPEGATPDQIEMHPQFLVRQTSERRSKLSEPDRQRSQKQAERATDEASIAKLEATIPPLQKWVENGGGARLLIMSIGSGQSSRAAQSTGRGSADANPAIPVAWSWGRSGNISRGAGISASWR